MQIPKGTLINLLKYTRYEYQYHESWIKFGKLPVDKESQPWSNNSPSGVLLLVLLACLPSTASRD